MFKMTFCLCLSLLIACFSTANADEIDTPSGHETLTYTFDGEVLCGQGAQDFLITITRMFEGRKAFSLNLRLLRHKRDYENEWMFFIDDCFDHNPEDCNAAFCTGFEMIVRNQNDETIAPIDQDDGSKLFAGHFIVEYLTGPRQGHMSVVLKSIPSS